MLFIKFIIEQFFLTKDRNEILRLTAHALGMVNLIWRNDRDRYLKIDWSNIKDQYKYNFYQWPFEFVANLDGKLFDYDSVLNKFDYKPVCSYLYVF